MSSRESDQRQTLIFSDALLNTGWQRDVRICVAEGMIEKIEVGVAAPASNLVAVPAMPNLHSHAFQRGMAGLSEIAGHSADSFWSWREVMYGFLDAMTPEDVGAMTALAFMEMVEAGFGRVGEFHYVHNDSDGRSYSAPAEMAEAVISAAEQAGIALTLLPVFYAHGNFGGKPPTHGQRRFVTDLDGFARLADGARTALAGLPRSGFGIAPHSLRAVTKEELTHLAEMAPDLPFHMHIAEQVKEIEDCTAWSGTAPVAWLLDNADVDGRWCLIHCTHMNNAETAALARTGATAGLCPLTEANLGDGLFDGATWLAGSGSFGIGTDSNILIGVAGELRQLEYSQRLNNRARNVLVADGSLSNGRALFDRAVEGGAKALGVATPILAEGVPADIVGLDASHPSFAARQGDFLLDSWIFAARSPVVRSVWLDGRQCVFDGRHIARDAIMKRYRKSLSRIMGQA